MIINLATIDFAPGQGGGVQPSGTVEITENGIVNVSPYEYADVSVPEQKPEEAFSQAITTNGSYTFTPTEGYVFSGGEVTVDVSGAPSMVTLSETINYNGDVSFSPSDYGVDAFNGVSLSVDVQPNVGPLQEVTNVSIYTATASDYGVDGFDTVEVEFQPNTGSLNETLNFNDSYSYTASDYGVDGFDQVDITVDVQPNVATLQDTVTVQGSDTITYQASDYGLDGFSDVQIDVSVSGGGASLVPLTDSITSNGSYSYIASDFGCDGFDQVDIAVSVPGIQPSGTIAVSANGTYDVTNYANVDVSVSGGVSRDYSYMSGTITGLSDLGWDGESIGCAIDNMKHYTWQDSAYAVTSNNIALYGVVNTSNKDQYRYNTDMVYLPYFDTSGVTNWESYFDSFGFRALPKLNMTGRTSGDFSQLFYVCNNLETIPPIDTQGVTNMYYMFGECNCLKNIPWMDTSDVENMEGMFYGCQILTSIPLLDTQSVTNMEEMFYGCQNLASIPLLDTQSVTYMNSMFQNCQKLKSIPLLDTQSVTNMSNMFANCQNLESIPLLDTQSVTNMSNMFAGCIKLKTIPALNTSTVEDMSSMFSSCNNLESVPALDTSNVTNMDSAFAYAGTSNHLSINGWDFSSIIQAPDYMFGYEAENQYVRHFIVNGKIDFDCSSANGFINVLTSIDYASVKSILQAMYRTTNNDPKEMVFNLTMIDPQGELAQLITDCGTKGWTVSGLTLVNNPVTMSYTSSDGEVVYPNFNNSGTFGSGVTYITTTYENGVGTWYFDTDPTQIGYWLFNNSNLATINIPNTVTSILDYAFYSITNQGFTSVTIPSSVTGIGQSAFSNCANLQTITMEGTTPPYLGAAPFSTNIQGFTIRVPQAALVDYQNDSNWGQYSRYMVGY